MAIVQSAAAKRYVSEAQYVLRVLASDIGVSGTRMRQRGLISKIRERLDTLDFVIGYEAVEREQGAAP